MFKKYDISKQLKILVAILFILFSFMFLNILLSYSNIPNNLASFNDNNIYKYLSIFLFISSILLSIFLMLIMKSIYHSISLLIKGSSDDSEDLSTLTNLILNMYHELKTPINVILGAIKLMENNDAEELAKCPGAKRHLKIVKLNSYRLLRLLNNVLDLSRINSGEVRINPINVNIVDFTKEILQSVSPYAEVKKIKLDFSSTIDEVITAIDDEKYERILLNLLSNAIKFSDKNGQVSVNIRSSNGRVLISVKDTGPGIPANMQKTIFERFRQVNSPHSSHRQGTGLGLSIVKSYVELHEGKMNLKSQMGKGSDFTVDLPIKIVEVDDRAKFFVDDHNINDSVNVEFSDIR